MHDTLVSDSWTAWWRLGVPEHLPAIEIIQSSRSSWILCMSLTVVSCTANLIVQTTHQLTYLAAWAPAGKQVGHRLMAAGYRTVVH